MRNLLAHRYEVLDLMELESVLTEDLQLLIANISSIIRDDPPS